MRKTILYISVFVCLSFIMAACSRGPATDKAMPAGKALDFTLNDLSGKSVSLSDFLGKKPLLLDFTTTWCPYCVSIIPQVKQIYADYKDKGLEVLAIYVNESKANVEEFASKQQLPYTVLIDKNGSVANKYGVRGVPTIVIVGKDGTIKDMGHRISMEAIEEAVK